MVRTGHCPVRALDLSSSLRINFWRDAILCVRPIQRLDRRRRQFGRANKELICLVGSLQQKQVTKSRANWSCDQDLRPAESAGVIGSERDEFAHLRVRVQEQKPFQDYRKLDLKVSDALAMEPPANYCTIQ